MGFVKEYKSKIFSVNQESFNQFALELFYFQAESNFIYKKYLSIIGIKPLDIKNIGNIPFMPVSFFKHHKILCKPFKHETVFYSSGTSGMGQSKHFVHDIQLYMSSFINCFELFFGNINEFIFLALLPSYAEQKNSSLIYMVQELIRISDCKDSGFYLYDHERLASKILSLRNSSKKIVLFGVSYALMDFAKNFSMSLSNTIVIETGGMKGRQKEITRQELHNYLGANFGLNQICSEYGMSELLSQAYSLEYGVFYTPPWMKVIISDQNDPFENLNIGETGIINVIDLANIYSCSFIKTQDLGKTLPGGGFEVLGRTDSSDIRGCSLMV